MNRPTNNPPAAVSALVGLVLFDVSARRLSQDHAAFSRRVDEAINLHERKEP